ncbi:Golgi CORVET complex core vacuolar protein 8-domain-containing protein [Gautieria morchelliformis]|nr:Golgi CORVET complex core vacuolar protein 8-domain-containing protein [Gautieria morchelliformis]
MSGANSHDTGLDELVSPVGLEAEGHTPELDLVTGDYTTRMEEVLGLEDEDEDLDFLYQGADSHEASKTYSEQLKGFLQGLDEAVSTQGDTEEEAQVEKELNETETSAYDEPPRVEVSSDRSPSTSSAPFSTFRPGDTSTIFNGSPSKAARPFIHPTISRLRSVVPSQQNKRFSSVSSFPDVSVSPSHFSAISRASSISNLPAHFEAYKESHESPREVFRWAVLRDIGQQIYFPKASSILGSFHGLPTALSANGLICIGTDRGRVLVFDFKQQLKCVCGVDDALSVGPVSALSLSRDHTFLAVGHASGYINLFDVSRPQTPARSVPPTSLAAVASGRKEGHIQGARILSICFVGTRHTAIVSADENGLAFYHSLGKVLFVEATDTLRILGKYPDLVGDMSPSHKVTQSAKGSQPSMNSGEEAIPANRARPRPWKPRKGSTILAMTSLPLGNSGHPTEGYNLVALLTSAKLVIVGLKPSPRTWFRRHRETANELSGSSKWRGCLAWFPSIEPNSDTGEGVSTSRHSNGKASVKAQHLGTRPILAYSWDRTLCLLRVSETIVRQTVQSTKNPEKTMVVEVGKVDLEEVARWSTDTDYLALQWLNIHQVLALTVTHLEVWDVRAAQQVERVPFDVASLSPYLETERSLDHVHIAHCMRVYKGKVFLLGHSELKVGTLLSWADRILSFVEDGDFLSAIDVTRAYYLGTAPGNKMGLPDDPAALRTVVGRRMRDLMTASARYAFAEDRMTDSTHVTPDGRGVDRTSLFEGLVTVCVNACLALDDFEFLFEDLFEYYQSAGIASIFLNQMEPHVLDGTIRSIPPRITQRLIAMHEDRGDLDKAERVIWHIDPDCLDINQAITLCRNSELYDALIYVYTRSLRDFVTPLVDLLGLIRQIQQHRRALRVHHLSDDTSPLPSSADSLERKAPDAYKIYAYLADILSGLTYPSQVPLPPDEAFQAKKDIYAFLFFGRSCVWPVGDGGKLILTSDEEGGVEPTYPYVRLLLRFDSEAFLHAMDIAFEDAYFNDETQGVSRLVVILVLLEILSSPDLSPGDATMLNIFIARNVPKYPQSIHTYMSPSTLHGILVGLATDTDQSTREDRQLATEYLLSVYMPHDGEHIAKLFEDAGFYRILRSWHRQEHKWGPLISTYLHDPDVDPAEVFESLDEVLTTASHAHEGSLPVEVLTTIMDAVPQLLGTGITETAFLIDKHASGSHSQVLESMGTNSSHRQFPYLRCLVEPGALSDDVYWIEPDIRRLPPSRNLDQSSKELYVQLLCKYDSAGVIRCLSSLDNGHFEWDRVISICEQNGVNEAVVWSLDKRGDAMGAFEKLKAVGARLASQVGEHLASEQSGPENTLEIQSSLNELKALGEIGLRLCCEHSDAGVLAGSAVEEMWFCLLSSQIDAVQTVSGFCASTAGEDDPVVMQEQRTLGSLRALVQETFTSLMAMGSSAALSFPHLFKRLVDSASSSRPTSRSSYSEFRLILTGMLESYRGEGDILLITNRLVERDLFTTVQELATRRLQGSRIRAAFCMACKSSLQRHLLSRGPEAKPLRETESSPAEDWVIQLTSGLAYHRRCLPVAVSTILS